MKLSRFILSIVLVNALLMGCTIKVQPVPMNTQVGFVGVVESNKIPLKVALVIPDPPTHKIMYQPFNQQAPMDQTAQMNEQLWPLNEELSKASKDVFSQIFQSVTLLRQVPMIGSDYDLIIIAKLKEVHLTMPRPAPFQITVPMELYYLWSLSAMDYEGVEIFKREDRTQTKTYMTDISMDVYVSNWGRASSELMAEMVKSWGLMIYDSRDINEYLRKLEEQ
jgi:hypothetical protein